MELRSLQLNADRSFRERAFETLDKIGIRTVADWESLSQDDRLKTPGLNRRIIRLVQEALDRLRNPDCAGQTQQLFLWDGTIYNDDRLFILDLQTAKKNNVIVWAVVTRWNHKGFPPYKVNDFKTQLEAIQFIKKIEPQTPRISLEGHAPEIPLSYIENLEHMKRNGEPSAFAIYESNKHQERMLILDEIKTL